jgi:hypothetical protein
MCAALECGVLMDVPMRPEEIRALMNQISQPRLAHVMPAENENGDDPPDVLSTADESSHCRSPQTGVQREAHHVAIHSE